MSQAPKRITALRPMHYLMLAVVSLALFLPGFFTIPPFDRDESRYAQASHQMLETGDFVDIRFQEEARHKKPVGIYWLQSASVSLLTGGAEHGPIWMYRLPSLLGAVAAVLLTAWAGMRLFGATVGLAAGLVLAGTVILGVEARMAKTDAVLLATIVAAQGALARIYLDRFKPGPAPLGMALVFWLAVGAGILVKGPIILIVTVGTVLMLWAMDRDLSWLKRLRFATGVPAMLLVVLPWLVAIGLATDGAFFSYAIGHEFLGKAHTGQEDHGAPPGYFLATFWLTFWPWSLLAVLALPWIWRNRSDDAVRFCIAWIVPTWLVFEIVVTKLPHYTLPVFPAIACLAVAAALDRFEGARGRGGLFFGLMAVIYLLVGLGFAAGIIAFPVQLTGDLMAASLLGGGVIVATAIAAILLEALRQPNRLMVGVVVGAALTYGTVHGLALPGLDPMWLSPRVAEAVERHRACGKDTVLAAAGYTEPSMVFLVGTNTRTGEPDMVAGHLAAAPGCALGLVTERARPRFEAAAATLGLRTERLETMPGFNYSRGREEVLYLLRAAPPAPPAQTPEQAPPAPENPAAAGEAPAFAPVPPADPAPAAGGN